MTLLSIDSEMSPETARALSDAAADPILVRLARRVDRRRLSRPGGAAREASYEVHTAAGELIEILLPAMRDGGSIKVVHHLGVGTLHSGRILRVPGTVLPETIMLSAPGRRLREIVDVGGTGVQAIADARIQSVFDDEPGNRPRALILYLDAPTVRPTIETN